MLRYARNDGGRKMPSAWKALERMWRLRGGIAQFNQLP
jgi:hypothetical protein